MAGKSPEQRLLEYQSVLRATLSSTATYCGVQQEEVTRRRPRLDESSLGRTEIFSEGSSTPPRMLFARAKFLCMDYEV